MQDRYAGDVGDFTKFALLRALSKDRTTLGIAWYLFPNENHNADGRHIQYLQDPARWRHLDPCLFDALQGLVSKNRSVRALEAAVRFDAAVKFSGEPLDVAEVPWRERDSWRANWFRRVGKALDGAALIFADPDNGLVDDHPNRRTQRTFSKQIPLGEATSLAQSCPAIIYHHNSRRAGGHEAEVNHWLKELGDDAIAIRANAYSCRTFFVLRADENLKRNAKNFCDKWRNHGLRIHSQIY